MWKPRNFWYTSAFSGKKTNNLLRRMLFLHCWNVHCFPKIKSKRKRVTMLSSVVLLSDLMAASSKQKEFDVSGGIRNTRKKEAMLVFKCKYCVWSQFQNVTGDIVDFDPVLSAGNKIQVLYLLPKIVCKFFSAVSEGKELIFWCSWNCGLWNIFKHLTSLERSIVW